MKFPFLFNGIFVRQFSGRHLVNITSTMIVVPVIPAHAFGSALSPGRKGIKIPSEYIPFNAHGGVMCFRNNCNIGNKCRMDRKSEKQVIFDVIKRLHNIERSSLRIPWPLSKTRKSKSNNKANLRFASTPNRLL